jgi:photosystem II stability/assembly factor-like uncharacterized protein
VDWTVDQPQTIFAARHESGGEMYISTDGGKSWTMTEKDPKNYALGVVDSNTLLASKGEGLLRSTDLGKTWAKVSEYTPTSRVMQTLGGVHYFFAKPPPDPAVPVDPKKKPVVPSSLLVSRDKGATWAVQGTPTDAAWGPYFGKDEKHVVTLGRKGAITESTDGGATWKEIAQVPKGFDTNNPGWFTNVAYDPTSDTIYISKMGQPAFKLVR